ncbi:hypothetical protein DSM43276_02268 [Mycobacteroides salmoniphilum]|nr:hypothetical protein DSM43276_02268 [Mycobacteroides salmoniphilum]
MSTESRFGLLLVLALIGSAAPIGAGLLGATAIAGGDAASVTYRADSWDDEAEFLIGHEAMNTYTPDSWQVVGDPQLDTGGRNSSGIGKSCNNPGVQCR